MVFLIDPEDRTKELMMVTAKMNLHFKVEFESRQEPDVHYVHCVFILLDK
jgi:hypothetical protein